MTTADWLADARAHADDLRALIVASHPAMKTYHPLLPITAEMPERASHGIRAAIADKYDPLRIGQDVPAEHPIVVFDQALAAGEVSTLMTVLSEAWFGVPESTSCWSVRGFAAAVNLLDDPPDDPDRED